MTLLPIENRRVRGTPATRYPINQTCAHPECDKPATDRHHIFRRSAIANDSWFVVLIDENGHEVGEPFAHVVGLCRDHHQVITVNESWIRMHDGEFSWWDQKRDNLENSWAVVDKLDPQPGGRHKSTKPKRRRFSGEARRKRKVISVRVPDDTEDGGAVWDETLELVKAKLVRMGLYSEGDKIPVYESIIAGLSDWITDDDSISASLSRACLETRAKILGIDLDA